MSSSKGEVEPTGTSKKESRKDSTRRSSTATQGWSNHSRSKWFIDWCCGDASNPTAQPCGPVIFIDDSRRRRVLRVVVRWEDAKGGRRDFYMQHVYGAKGNVVANSKGTLLDRELCEGFRAGAVNTPFYKELVLEGGFVLAREFFDMLEDKNIALDVPCDVNPSLELSLPMKLCSGCESSGAAVEGGDLGSGPATQLHHGESGGQFDDSEDEGTAPPLSDTRRSMLSIRGVQTDAPVQRKSTRPAEQVAAYSEVEMEASEGQGVEEVDAGGLASQGAPQKRRGDRPDEFAGSTKKLKSKAPRTAREKRKGTEGEQGRQVVDLGDWEDLYNQRSLDLVLVEGIKEAMRLALENKAQSHDLPTLKLAPLGLDKPTPGTKVKRLRPEDWRDELAGQYYYYAVCGQHNAAAARSLLGSEVARKYNFERWPARMVYFSDDDFEGYFLVSSQDNKKDMKAPPRQLKLSMRDIRWQWKRVGCPHAVMGNPNGKQDQVRKWREFCSVALNMTPHNNLWILADQQGEEAIRKKGAALRSYFPLAMAGENVWKQAIEFFEKWETGRLLEHDGAKWIMRKKKVKNVKPGVAYIHNDKLGRKEVVYNVPVDPPTKKGKKEKEEGEWFTLVVFVPRQQNLSFLASMNHLSFVKLLEGKWVRTSQQKKSFPVGNNLYTEDDRMYILFKDDDLRVNTSVVYEGKLPAGAAAAVRVPQKVTQTDVSDIPFNPRDWSHTSPAWRGSVYGDMERNPVQFVQLLESITNKGEGVVFLGKPHARSVWEVLKARRHVITMDGNSELLQFTIDLVKSEVNSGAHNCEFMVVTETRARAWNNKTDMWFKLSVRKRNKIYDFLFRQTRPKRDTDAEYMRRKDHMFTLLDNYQGASRMNAKTFLERLQSLYFVESEEELMFGSYSFLISTEDEETTGIEFDVTADEEGSDTESLDLQYD
ncbi:hypothetical protein CBR_g55763 [Chara braunii]|uniref:Uncharacterized protein n=1 Tax=Chara braunii TaxID=69332 RepID=A0A388MD51_CHABU|nr:hypothetical protein CBR_g55763 [Chara braunii]|eukprot:GBG92490.1 hypothetical protein CBR_g55763 [Chara braunii]